MGKKNKEYQFDEEQDIVVDDSIFEYGTQYETTQEYATQEQSTEEVVAIDEPTVDVSYKDTDFVKYRTLNGKLAIGRYDIVTKWGFEVIGKYK